MEAPERFTFTGPQIQASIMDAVYKALSNAAIWTSQCAPPISLPWTPYFVSGIVSYIGLCSALRFRRVRRRQAKLHYPDSESLSRMTIPDAQEIVCMMAELEFPLMYDLSLRMAIFKTYGMENVARVLAAYSDLAKRHQSAKRYEDTAILYACFAFFKPTSQEFIKSVSRMNFLHSPYIKANNILNEDLLYVLWASMADPVTFIRLYEWRPLTDMEHAALGTLWLHIGHLMGIDYKKELGKDKWVNGKEFMEELAVWALNFEDVAMKPTENARLLGEVLMELLLSVYPKFVRSTVRQASLVFMTEKMRRAFDFPEPNLGTRAFVYSALFIRQLLLRYLALPRFSPVKYISETNPETGRIHHYTYLKEPWFNPKTFWSRWGPEAMLSWVLGVPRPGDGGANYRPEGFLFEDIGPRNKAGKGLDEMSKIEEEIRAVPIGCPFSSPEV